MRVSSNTFTDQFINQLQDLQQRLITAQRAAASGQRIHESSDDPVAFRRSLEIQSIQKQTLQFRDTISKVHDKTEASYNAATQLQTIVSQAVELAIRSGGTTGADGMAALSTDANSLLEQALAIANRQDQGQFLFSGVSLQPTDTDTVTALPFVPFIATRVAGQITGVTYSTVANQVVKQSQVSASASMDVNVLGLSAAGTPTGLIINGAVGGATDVLQQLINLRDNLASGSVAGIQTAQGNLNTVQNNIAMVIGTTAGNLNRLQLLDANHNAQTHTDENTISSLIDADLATSLATVQQTQTLYQAALQSGAKILDLSLLNFLR